MSKRKAADHVIVAFIRQAAKKNGVASVAEAAGICRQTLYRVLEKDANPSLDTVVKIVGGQGYGIYLQEARDAEYLGGRVPKLETAAKRRRRS